MTPGEFRKVAKAMQKFGISYAKMGDVELRRDSKGEKVSEAPGITKLDGSNPSPVNLPMQGLAAQLEEDMYKYVSNPAFVMPDKLPEGITTEPEDPIKHKVEQLTSLLKLSDHDLVDQLFPDHTQEESA